MTSHKRLGKFSKRYTHRHLAAHTSILTIQSLIYTRLHSSDQILLCIWLEPEKPKCDLKDAVHFSYNISDRLSLDIPVITREFGGLYLCHLLPTDDTPDHPCNLTVLEGRSSPSLKLRQYNPYIYRIKEQGKCSYQISCVYL